MLKDRRILIFWALIAAFAIWILWWGSSGFILEHKICGNGPEQNDCSVYDVFSYSAWRLARAANDWSALIAALATIAIAGLAGTTYLINRDQLSHNRLVERAYVKMSHRPPGVRFGAEPSIDISIEVKNFGNTPVTVTELVVNCWFSNINTALPEQAVYEPMVGSAAAGAFLVSGDSYLFNGSVPVSEGDIAGLRNRTRQLHIIGYVDYVDQFGARHRGGYARFYDRERENNLIYVREPGYNYDRLRVRGEGGDWNENLRKQ